MSNTSTVTPYATDNGPSAISTCIEGVIQAGTATATWLAKESDQDRAATERFRDRARRDRLATVAPPQVCSVTLTVRQREPLLEAATTLGYRVDRTVSAAPSTLCLVRPSGERLAIERSTSGRLLVHTAGARARVNELVRQHTVERAVEHLRASGMAVQAKPLATGEVQIAARERTPVDRAGQATVLAQVHDDGTVWVDVDGVRGRRCEGITRGLAEAVGGEVDAQVRKPAWHQEPGEPTRTGPRKVRV